MFGLKVKSAFFDSAPVRRAVDKTTRRVLSRFGSFVRSDDRKSMRKRKGASRPGRPPSVHVGTLKRLIFFAYDFARRSVVIGPVLFASRSKGVPEALEEGGTTTTFTRRGRRRQHVDARPHTGPAFQKNLPQVPNLWRDSVRR